LGFAVSYRSTKPVEPSKFTRVQSVISKSVRGRTWLSSEPAWVMHQDDGHLIGASKPNMQPDPDDAAAARSESLPDGTIADVVQILCDISQAEGIDWELSHDHSSGPIGLIRNGIADPNVLTEIETIAEVCQVLGEAEISLSDHIVVGGEKEGSVDVADANPPEPEDDDDGPRILKFSPRKP
jgi:hypothetical protein